MSLRRKKRDEHPVRTARREKGWRLEDLGLKAACSKPLLSNIERGYVPQETTMIRIANALDRSLKQLWPEEFE